MAVPDAVPVDYNVEMLQFSLKRMFVSISLIAVGAGMLACLLFERAGGALFPIGQIFAMWFSSGALIGAGLFTPFKRPIVGAFIGLIAMTLLLIFGQQVRE